MGDRGKGTGPGARGRGSRGDPGGRYTPGPGPRTPATVPLPPPLGGSAADEEESMGGSISTRKCVADGGTSDGLEKGGNRRSSTKQHR